MSLHRRRSPPCSSPVGGLTTAAASVIPQGVGAPPPPGLDPKKGKLMCIKVRMLDDTVGVFHLGHRALGQALFDEVCRHLNLLEGDYFGLEFYDCFGNRCWLDYQKPILRQITQTRSDARFYFVVKFYTPNPAELEEEYTRYLFALQIKRDLATGNLPCNDNTAALMSSYIVQAECGDYVPEDYPDHTYLSVTKFVPNQDAEFEKRVFENHKKHVNTSPAEADMALLETARRCEMYGVKLHPAKDHEGVPINLSVLHSGVSVFQGLNCINKFSWAKIRKLSFKRKRFLIKLHPESFGFYKENVDFSFDNRNECKMFWKKCIEHHSFFRCSEVPRTPRQQFEFFSKGSSFRFSGRTQKQLIEYVREHHKRREPFQRPLLTMTPANALHRDYRTASAERTFPTPLLPIASSSSRLNGDIVSNGTVSPQTIANGDGDQSHPRAPHASSVSAPPGYDDESAIASGLRDGHAAIEEPGTPKLPRKILPVLQQQFHTYEPSSVQHAYNCAANTKVSPPPSLCQSRRTEFTLEDSRRLARLHSVDSSSSGHATLAAGSSPLLCDDHSHANNALQRSHQASNGSAAASPRRRAQQHSFTSPARNGSIDHRGSNGAVFPVELGSLRLPLSPSSNFGSEVVVNQLEKANHLTQSERILTAKSVPADGEDEAATALNRPSHHRSVPVLKQKTSVRLSPTTSMKCSQTLAKLITDKTYFIVKELLMTERTYVRELNLISEHFRTAIANTFASMSLDQATQLMLEEFFASLEPIALAHNHFLANLEHRFAIWEQRILSSSSLQQLNHHGPLNIGDLFLGCVNTYLKVYQHYLAHLAIYLASLDELYRLNKTFMDVYKNFELQGICYLPVTALLMRPAYRLLHYQSILERLIEQHADQYGNQSAQRVIIINSTKVSEEESAIFASFHECQMVLDRLVGLNLELKDSIRAMANFSKLSELERDLVAVDNLVQPRRVFIREGCLQRFSRKGPMQRMFFLFNDCLLYANRILGHALLRFRVNGQIPLRGLMLEDGDPFKVACDGAHCFTIYGANRSLIVSASSIEEKQAWVEDISKAVMCAKETAVDAFPRYSSLKSCGSIDEVDGYHTSLQSTSYDASGARIESGSAGNLDVVYPSSSNAPHSPMSDRTFHYRANHSSHVCWHRQTTISARDLEISVETALSGYLLRKFRNSSGWQKLWVVFTHFCLFFYKSHLEDLPLASLPLLGYRVSPPESDDGLSKKDFTFKLYYRTHFYFFRAESQYAYERWLTALQSVVASSTAVLNDGALSLPEQLKEFTADRIRETKDLLTLAS